MRKVTKQWTMRDGGKIRICDMSDDHLLNTIKMLERNHGVKAMNAMSFAASCRGEMATYYADQMADQISLADTGDIFPIYNSLCDEADRREIKYV